MPTIAIPFDEAITSTVSLSAITLSPAQKTHNGKKIPFPAGKDPEHVRRVRKILLARLAHLEGFFSKKASTKLPPSQLGHDMVLELIRPLEGKPSLYRIPISLLPLEKEIIDELLRIGFIELSMDETAASVLFVPKPYENAQRFCVDYRWVNQFLVLRLVMAPNVNGTITNCRNAKRMSKIDIIRAFNRLLVYEDSRYLTAFKIQQGTVRWKVLPFGLKVGPAQQQAFINSLLNELLDKFASAYANNVLIYTDKNDEETHFTQVEEIIYRLH